MAARSLRVVRPNTALRHALSVADQLRRTVMAKN
jgi:hypothetical protein